MADPTPAPDVLERILTAPAPPPAIPTLAAWLDDLDQSPFSSSVDRAIFAGFEADRLGFAFTGGYEAALAALLAGGATIAAPVTASAARRSLAATEAGGNHPRAITTRREGGRLVGEKTFATLASIADEILVVASEGLSPDGRPRIRIVKVARKADGLTIEDRPPTPFAPEIPHARLRFDGVDAPESACLPGDGYATYLKPFRTIEDLHVLAATLGHVVRVARAFRFVPLLVEDAVLLLAALRAIATRDHAAPDAHLSLAAAFRAARALLESHAGEWKAKAPPDLAARWERDQPLLLVAEGARAQRTASAWKALGGLTAPQG